MSDLHTILGLVNKVQSQDELKAINQAVNSRWHQLQTGAVQKVVQEKAIAAHIPGRPSNT